jgi:uncharacterized protein (UPF0332 family)
LSPEASDHLAKAAALVQLAVRLLDSGFHNDAARNAYLSAHQAAQAYLVEHAGRAAKSHKGAQSQFCQLALQEPRITKDMRSLLSRTYQLKSIADYEIGPGSDVAPETATSAVQEARQFVDRIAGLLQNPSEPRDHV